MVFKTTMTIRHARSTQVGTRGSQSARFKGIKLSSAARSYLRTERDAMPRIERYKNLSSTHDDSNRERVTNLMVMLCTLSLFKIKQSSFNLARKLGFLAIIIENT
jgi:hypothetical protein